MVTSKVTNSEKETKSLAKEIISSLTKPNVICLYGDLASGKTTFTQGIGEYYGISRLLSPTYVIARQYPLSSPIFSQLVHLDLYRLENIDDLKSLDLFEIWNDPKNLVVIEWPEKIADFLPKNRIDIHFVNQSEDHRQISINYL